MVRKGWNINRFENLTIIKPSSSDTIMSDNRLATKQISILTLLVQLLLVDIFYILDGTSTAL